MLMSSAIFLSAVGASVQLIPAKNYRRALGINYESAPGTSRTGGGYSSRRPPPGGVYHSRAPPGGGHHRHKHPDAFSK